jgi:hypothetical protein
MTLNFVGVGPFVEGVLKVDGEALTRHGAGGFCLYASLCELFVHQEALCFLAG